MSSTPVDLPDYPVPMLDYKVLVEATKEKYRAEGAAAEREKIRKMAEAKAEQYSLWADEPSNLPEDLWTEDDLLEIRRLRWQADAMASFEVDIALMEKP